MDIFKIAGDACFGPYVVTTEHPPCEMVSTKTIDLAANEFTRIDPPLLDCPPPDPLRRAAESIELGTKMTAPQTEWARHHDWFVQATPDGVVIVVDHFTYKDHAYSERIIWGGTFAELRDWAGY
jgi:hypothetical protein